MVRRRYFRLAWPDGDDDFQIPIRRGPQRNDIRGLPTDMPPEGSRIEIAVGRIGKTYTGTIHGPVRNGHVFRSDEGEWGLVQRHMILRSIDEPGRTEPQWRPMPADWWLQTEEDAASTRAPAQPSTDGMSTPENSANGAPALDLRLRHSPRHPGGAVGATRVQPTSGHRQEP